MLDYFNKKRAKKAAPVASDEPLLTEEDELFLQKITSEPEGPAPDLPPRPQTLPVAGETVGNDQQLILRRSSSDDAWTPGPLKDAQTELMHGADGVPLPHTPEAREIPLPGESPLEEDEGKGKGKAKEKKNPFAFLRRGSSTKRKAAEEGKGPKSPEEEKEAEDLEDIMEQLNFSAVNNRVFSVSKESRELLRKFTLVLKDLVNGVPTAYDDLEKLLTNSEDTLGKTFKAMPEWMQELIGKLPSKMTKSVGPEFLAAAAEKHGLKSSTIGKGAAAAERAGVKVRVPSLKELVTRQGAIAGLLRTIVSFLRTRFPAVLGVSTLWSVAIFLLLLVFWYCHKRGKEVRLEKERAMTASEMEAIRVRVAADPPADYDPAQPLPTTTTAAEGADLGEVQRGIAEVQAARAAAAAQEAASGSQSLESSQYAPGGSLAASLRVDEEERRSVTPTGKGREG